METQTTDTPSSPSGLKERALHLLNLRYGYPSFRGGQWEVMESILAGRDTLVLMPTGGGKSICFQIPALMKDGCCIVVSPLIALMNDQVAALTANGIPAAAINSLRSEADNQLAYRRAEEGELKLLYLSPERLLSDLDGIRRHIPVSFIAVDEAHCISQWGHDFRPVYTSLSAIKERWPELPVMALTATADRLTRDDISRALGLKDPYIYIGSFDRPNLSLEVVNSPSQADRIKIISGLIDRNPMDCGILYCLSRKKTEQMARQLIEKGYRVASYHAGMSAEERENVQREFLTGRLQAICATIAFGMGIDKSNIRWVVHNNIPGNIESFYQEIGRAGRDGLPADTILFYNYGDVMSRMRFVEESGQREINKSKLGLMQKYSESSICRRRILLSYFGEESGHDCGNCDNCRSPRSMFDGTILAQKALSAIIRTGGNEGIGTIIEILRGMTPRNIIEKGYDRLPTFGVGSDLSTPMWQAYILQMQQLGFIEVAYDRHFHLRPTEAGMRVVRGRERIQLATYVAPSYAARRRSAPRPAAPSLSVEELISDALKQLRMRLATERGVPDYIILSDVTIADIASRKPLTVDSLASMEGMGVARLHDLYKDILQTVRYTIERRRGLPRGSSDAVSRVMFGSGMAVEEIAAERRLAIGTVVGHLVNEYAAGKSVQLERILSPVDFERVRQLLDELSPSREENPEGYSAALKELEDTLERLGMRRDDLQRTLSLRRIVEAADGEYRLLPIVSEPTTPYGESEPEADLPESEPVPPDDDSDWSDWDMNPS